jgi:hypothetical protein
VTGLTTLEQSVLDLLLAGEESVLERLRAQVEAAELVSRDLTGVGFYCNFRVPVDAQYLPTDLNFEINGVEARIPGLERGAGFVLFVKLGRIAFLEGFTYDEVWPGEIDSFSLAYSPLRAQDLLKLNALDALVRKH